MDELILIGKETEQPGKILNQSNGGVQAVSDINIYYKAADMGAKLHLLAKRSIHRSKQNIEIETQDERGCRTC